MLGRNSKQRITTATICLLLIGCVAIPSRSAQSQTTNSASHTKKSRKKKPAKVRGQQKIDSDRAQQIQTALIREHYLNGEPTGTWDSASEEAMRRFQADNGWQNKTVPDSRALIKLGLGPSKDHLLNPDSAMTTIPDAPTSAAISPTSNTSPAVANPASPTTNSPDSSRPQ
jgi:peptidoglycan hydrolase-like protein with peptidoglycan-binding domain